MEVWKIAKEFNFCYGHRVWTQTLNSEYSLDSQCACRHLHGHQGVVRVFLEANELENTGMVTDFKHLNWLKKFLDDVLDHKFILDRNDPLFKKLLPDVILKKPNHLKYWIPDLDSMGLELGPEHEYYEGFVIVDFPPTSENFSKWLFDIVDEKMSKINIKTTRVQFFETPKSQSNYEKI